MTRNELPPPLQSLRADVPNIGVNTITQNGSPGLCFENLTGIPAMK